MQHESVVRNVQSGDRVRAGGNSARCAVGVYLADPAQQDERDLARAWLVLDDDERVRADRFQLKRDRQIYIVAHALLRGVLAQHTGIGARDLRFSSTRHGRPELADVDMDMDMDGAGAPGIRFNLSHTRGLVGCAVTPTADIGFDVEETRVPAPLEVAPRYFSGDELGAMRRVPAARQDDRFYTLWTLKESYIKGRGLGLAIPLDSFTCDPLLRGRARVTLADQPHNPTPWTLRWWRFDRHAAALAIRAPDEQVDVALATDLRIDALLAGVGMGSERVQE